MFSILIAGDDKRSLNVARHLEVNLKDKKIIFLKEKEQLKKQYNVYIMPIPLSLDKVKLNNSSENFSLTELFESIPEQALIIAAYSDEQTVNITSRDDFAYKNAVPTAEGAIALAINATDKTLFESNILITGFGRVAKILAHRLKSFSQNITVAVRKSGDFSHIEALGLKAQTIESIAENIGRYDIIFNTVPFEIFNKETLSAAKNGSAFIELASNQSGFDIKAAKELPIIYINAPGLPGKVAPSSAGKIMAETVISIIKEKFG